jgi:hypothetical protein
MLCTGDTNRVSPDAFGSYVLRRPGGRFRSARRGHTERMRSARSQPAGISDESLWHLDCKDSLHGASSAQNLD